MVDNDIKRKRKCQICNDKYYGRGIIEKYNEHYDALVFIDLCVYCYMGGHSARNAESIDKNIIIRVYKDNIK